MPTATNSYPYHTSLHCLSATHAETSVHQLNLNLVEFCGPRQSGLRLKTSAPMKCLQEDDEQPQLVSVRQQSVVPSRLGLPRYAADVVKWSMSLKYLSSLAVRARIRLNNVLFCSEHKWAVFCFVNTNNVCVHFVFEQITAVFPIVMSPLPRCYRI